jgi:predicted phage terminase large subunit-like protein
MTPEQLDVLLKTLPLAEKADLLALMDELEARKRTTICQNDFLAFIAAIDPAYKFGTHLKKLGTLLMEVEEGDKDRIAVSMPPRFGKSQMISIYYPAWYLGRHPDHQVIVASHTVDLAVDMARKVRNLMKTREYKAIFPGVEIAADAKAAGKWNTTKGGVVYATGVGGALAGRGAHLIIADDCLSEQDLKAGNTTSLDGVYDWFRNGLRTRLMPGGAICILHTRWHLRDLIGRLVKDATLNEEGDQYEVFEFPAILEFDNPAPEADPTSNTFNPDAPKIIQKSLWPEQWSLESLLRTKASMPAWQWNAQYQQNPTAQEAAIIKRDHIKWWQKDTPPGLDFIVQSYDTALTTKARSDYSVCQTWGVWTTEDGLQNAILLNSVSGKWEFPELKKMALQQAKDWSPDSIIVEAKASGQPLIDEMRRSGLFVQDYSPGKGQDKIARVNAISDMFASGQVWFPETHWATGVVEELLAFPAGEHDDQVDALTLALIRIRKGGFMKLAGDVQDDTPLGARRSSGYY